jgi:hypothetical protein
VQGWPAWRLPPRRGEGGWANDPPRNRLLRQRSAAQKPSENNPSHSSRHLGVPRSSVFNSLRVAPQGNPAPISNSFWRGRQPRIVLARRDQPGRLAPGERLYRRSRRGVVIDASGNLMDAATVLLTTEPWSVVADSQKTAVWVDFALPGEAIVERDFRFARPPTDTRGRSTVWRRNAEPNLRSHILVRVVVLQDDGVAIQILGGCF